MNCIMNFTKVNIDESYASGGWQLMIRIMFNQQLDEKAFRERRRIPLTEVAEVTGLSRPTLSRIANVPGYVTGIDTIEVLCRYFACQPGELLVLVDETDGQNSSET